MIESTDCSHVCMTMGPRSGLTSGCKIKFSPVGFRKSLTMQAGQLGDFISFTLASNSVQVSTGLRKGNETTPFCVLLCEKIP